jgi:hypothetical protein
MVTFMVYLQGLTVMNEAVSGVADVGGLVDIIEPAAPVLAADGNWPWIAAAVAMLVILAVAILLLLKYKLPAYRAIGRLRKLRQQALSGELTPHESVFMLALELRHGLGIKRLRAEEVPAVFKPQDRSLWPEFMRRLDIMLYQRGAELDAGVLAALFAQIEKWLWRYSR